jgi:hypothetical protein
MLPPTGNCFSGWRPYGCGKDAFILRLENAAGLAVASAYGQQSSPMRGLNSPRDHLADTNRMDTNVTPSNQDERKPKEAFQIVFLIAALLIAPAAITLHTVAHPGVLEITAKNPTPLGYAISLLLFLVPQAALGWWFARRAELALQR